MKKPLLLLTLLAAVAVQAQQSNVNYSHTMSNGVNVYSNDEQEKKKTSELNNDVRTPKAVCYYTLEEVEKSLMDCDSKLAIARENHDAYNVQRYEKLKTELITRKQELSKQQ